MMSYPSLDQYQEALQNPKLALIDPELASGSVATTGLGLPLALCGGFALTFTITAQSGNRYAVRCFHKKSDSLEARYQAISKTLSSLSSDYFVGFQFQPKGIRIDSALYPVVKMNWATGETLGEFLENNYSKRASIAKLRDFFIKLSSFLASSKISHGDIQNGNVVVRNGGIYLIDYDGMYVDGIRHLGSSELGHRNFQHPLRRPIHFDDSLDRFSFISIYVALKALESDPELWKMHSNGENILFTANDFADPDNSSLFRKLFSTNPVAQEAKNFAQICESPFEKIPTLEDFIAGRNIPLKLVVPTAKPGAGAVVKPYISTYPVLDASIYSECLKVVGDRVELIGQIFEVKQGYTRWGHRPYVFINFGHWKGNITKINIWSDGLQKLKNKPDQSWVGKWISVTGLMEPPYVSSRFKYSHLAISVTENNQLRVISEQEATYRLTSPKISTGVPKSRTANSNVGILEKMGLGTPTSAGQGTITSEQPGSQNQAILSQMKKTATGVSTTLSRPTAQKSTSAVPQPPAKRLEKSYGWIWIIIIIGILLFFLFGKR